MTEKLIYLFKTVKKTAKIKQDCVVYFHSPQMEKIHENSDSICTVTNAFNI